MLTLDTMRELGYESRLDPKQSIEGGARYLEQLRTRLPERISDPDRTPSARMLAEMEQNGEEFYHFAMRKSREHQQWFAERPLGARVVGKHDDRGCRSPEREKRCELWPMPPTNHGADGQGQPRQAAHKGSGKGNTCGGSASN